MIVSTILLSPENVYVDKDGNLPYRPNFDKDLLREVVRGQRVSFKAKEMLPESIASLAYSSHFPNVGITIPEIDELTDLLIVIRSADHIEGKKFRFDNFYPILKLKDIELWRRREDRN